VTPENVNLVVAIAVGIALGFVALAALIAALALWRLARDVRRVTDSANEALGVVNTELPATLKELRQAASNLDRVSAERDYMRLHVGARSWLIHHSMAALEERLDPQLFVRLHRSAIVRRDFITGFSRNPSGRWIARLGDESEQPVGRLYADRVRSIAGR